MCVHMCIMNLHVHDCVYLFSCFLCYLGLKITASFCLSPILRFNKAYWFCLQSLPVSGLLYCYKTLLLHVLQTGFTD